MQTLSYGYLKPETGDKGTTLFTALEGDIQRLNDHTHNGTDSASLPAQSISAVTQTILSAAWVASGATGHYRQLVTCASGFTIDATNIGFRSVAGHIIFPTVEKVTATTFYVYTTDSSAAMTAVYK